MATHTIAPRELTVDSCTDSVRRHFQTTVEPRLSVVIVNFCQWEATAQLVRQLRSADCARHGAVEVMIVDNHSPPHPMAAKLRRRFGVSLRRSGRNRGFARAVNEGSRLSRGDWLLLLNPDITVSSDFLDDVLKLTDVLTDEEPRTGIVGFQLRNNDGTRQLSTGSFPTLLSTLLGMFRSRSRRKYRPTHGRRRSRVSWATGCCFLIRRDCLDELGGMDEDYFLYYEDVDLCRRAKAARWRIWHEPALWAIHHRPLHERAVSPAIRICTRHSLLTYASKHWTPWQFAMLAGIVGVEAWLRQRFAAWRGSATEAMHFRKLGDIVSDIMHGKPRAARRRLNQIIAPTIQSKSDSLQFSIVDDRR